MPLRTVAATRYVTPLREGGSLPAIVEADDDGLYVLKFRGAGQGPNALVAEVLAGEIARAAGLAVPELVLMELDPDLGRTEPDPEIQALIRASAGVNLALDYLPGATTFDPVVDRPDGELASAIVWLDALVTNVDRTVRNTNMLLWHRKIWLIDNGAALFAQYSGPDFPKRAQSRFPQIREHVLLPHVGDLRAADKRLSARLSAERLSGIVDLIPESWLGDEAYPSVAEERKAYESYLIKRLTGPRAFVEEAIDARSRIV